MPTSYTTLKPPSPQRSRIILGDGSIKKVQFVGKIDLVFHSRTDYQVTLHNVSFVPDLGFNLFFVLRCAGKARNNPNKTGAHLLGGRLVFPRRRMGRLCALLEYCRVVKRTRITHLQLLLSPFPTVSTDPPLDPLPLYRTVLYLPPLYTKHRV